ncbi:translation initiation factor IF-2 [Fervidobacterium pennivorans subsp. shakshaketiis]|uniref:Translation initiation factor IF-2 n=1 Tax=Fervidobacterium pennivorans (strain DSM 9078 / Ven5) TaxID=771875 RepID=H9UEB1_FERPD|nr:translation initiation factor IF-2 [Fervidobacterium pennivorans]AFG35854.1 translation initiation factor IF-2 [Fervidobacterium pennivorans DSM 9078]QIV78580.1 translation initiation factor IF-2 [Fervidobacterium pennivorans subsp. keratinolyticus]
MARLRVYELAKQLDMDTKELLHELEELGIEVKSHMSFIDEETVNILLEIYKETLDEEEDVTLTKTKEPTKEKVEAKKPPVHITEEDLKLDKFAEKIKVPQNRIIQDFFMKGEVLRPGQPISVSLAKKIAKMYDVRLTFEEEQGKEEVKLENPLDELKRQFEILYQDKEKLVPRPPVVTVMGHVDHGKTTLLDYIRKTRIAEKEEGGITQSIGAYQVVVNGKKITFIDTPGHEVFTEMRARGAQATDIVVLVVAADDGVMPQTIEAYNHAKSANVPIIVAINKIDKPNANVELTKQDLVTKLNLIPEEWGGDTIVVPISARNGTNVDTLLEMILLVAEMQDIRCIPDKPVRAVTIETRLDKGYGPVANAIVKDGILKVGDYVVAGKVYGKVKALIDDKGKRINQAEPSTPVMIVGFEELPDPHSIIYVVESKEKAEEIVEKVREIEARELRKKRQIKLEEILKKMQEGEKKELKLILKADTVGSLQALQNAIAKLRTNEIDIDIVHAAVGAINTSDVMLASASEAIILGFRVKADSQSSKLAESEGVQIKTYTIIYKLLEDLKAALEGMLEPEEVEEKTGTGEIKKVFKIHKYGNVAGVQVYDGYVDKSGFVRIYRNGSLVFEGKIESLKHYQQDVNKISAPQECGIKFQNFDDIKEGDELEFYIIKKVPRKLTAIVEEPKEENN